MTQLPLPSLVTASYSLRAEQSRAGPLDRKSPVDLAALSAAAASVAGPFDLPPSPPLRLTSPPPSLPPPLTVAAAAVCTRFKGIRTWLWRPLPAPAAVGPESDGFLGNFRRLFAVRRRRGRGRLHRSCSGSRRLGGNWARRRRGSNGTKWPLTPDIRVVEQTASSGGMSRWTGADAATGPEECAGVGSLCQPVDCSMELRPVPCVCKHSRCMVHGCSSLLKHLQNISRSEC